MKSRCLAVLFVLLTVRANAQQPGTAQQSSPPPVDLNFEFRFQAVGGASKGIAAGLDYANGYEAQRNVDQKVTELQEKYSDKITSDSGMLIKVDKYTQMKGMNEAGDTLYEVAVMFGPSPKAIHDKAVRERFPEVKRNFTGSDYAHDDLDSLCDIR